MITLEPIEIYYGIEALILTLITVIISAKIISKYFAYKHANLIFIGIAVLGLTSRIWPMAITFLFIIFTREPASAELYFILGHGLPYGFISWMIGWVLMTEMKKNTKKLILIPVLFIEFIYLLVFYISIFSNLSLIGTYTPIYNEQMGIVVIIHSYYKFSVLYITLSKLFFDTRKTNNKEIRLKGNLISVGMICMFLAIQLTYLFKQEIFYAFFLLLGILLIYHGILLPKWLKKRIMKLEPE